MPRIARPTVPGFSSHRCGLAMVAAPSMPPYVSQMTGPHHAIICSFTGRGHGAAEWTIECRLDTSYFERTSAGSWSSRWNWVGTM